MRKKIIICLMLLILTGCKNQMKCTMEKEEENYVVKQEVTMQFNKDDSLKEANMIINLNFENEQDSQNYYDAFKQLDNIGDIKKDGKKIIIEDEKEYSDDSTKTELKQQLNKSGYKCN